MGFWQNLATSYDKNYETLKSKFPLSTTTISNNGGIIAVITIDKEGSLISIDKIEKAKKKEGRIIADTIISITIPVTEYSMSRTSSKNPYHPHPVFDQYEYLNGEGEKFGAYIEQFKHFAESKFTTEQIKAIYNYVSKKSIAKDLVLLNPDVSDKTYVIFEVITPRNPQTKVWEDEIFFEAWHNYYVAQQKKNGKALDIDYLSGDKQLVSISHPKKISNASANSKLISDNDKTNFTFRGKFRESSEALSIGYESSQKAHQFLRYLIGDRGIYCDTQVILSYTIDKNDKLPSPLSDTKSLYDEFKEISDVDEETKLSAETGRDYASALKKALGYGISLPEKHEKTAVIALDAATKGRFSIIFYRELDKTEYLEKIADWHNDCKWHQGFWDKKKKKYKYVYIGAPSVDRIIEAVYGKSYDKSYNKIKKAARERLLHCIFDGEQISKDYISAAVRRISNPLGITKDGKFDQNGFEQILSTVCALVRKFYNYREKEDYKLALEHDRNDRDYLYGRLLGVADKLESYALSKTESDRKVTGAIYYMNAFSRRPHSTWLIIHERLSYHLKRVKGIAFDEIQLIKGKFVEGSGDFENDTPLNGSYLLGYYHERAEIDRIANELYDAKKQQANNEGGITK
ncbi:MAG: type I-C CRISPR-associated protein Cas8c/Csd1 [Helicobacteraceae bacterium]|jgi:CRISPR-associated protein Csd1|nr:type I-C CRISPR-associated protein Cas8c/Csd1 [Helicobacteraceae bacterium]